MYLTQIVLGNLNKTNIEFEIHYKEILPYLAGVDEPWFIYYNVVGPAYNPPHEKREIVDIKSLANQNAIETVLLKSDSSFNMIKFANSLALEINTTKNPLDPKLYSISIPKLYLKGYCLRAEISPDTHNVYYLTEEDMPIFKNIRFL